MALPQINWEDGRYFLAVARLGTLGKAAESLNMSTITLSRHLSQMQSRTRTQLLVRHSKGLRLTDEGQRLVDYLERIESEFEAASELFGGSLGEISGTVRIAAPEGFALRVLTPNLRSLIEQHPKLRIEIVPQPRGFSLSRREADVAIIVGKPSERNLRSIPLGQYFLGVYAAQSYLETAGTPETVEELVQHRLIGYVEDLLFSPRLNTAQAVWSGWESHLSIYSPVGQVEAVKAGLGIGVLHQFLVSPGELVRLLPDIEVQRDFHLVCHPNTEGIPRIRAVIEFLTELELKLSAPAQ